MPFWRVCPVAANLEKLRPRHFGVRMFDVFRFVIQSFFRALERATGGNAKPQNIEQANFEGKPPDLCSRRNLPERFNVDLGEGLNRVTEETALSGPPGCDSDQRSLRSFLIFQDSGIGET